MNGATATNLGWIPPIDDFPWSVTWPSFQVAFSFLFVSSRFSKLDGAVTNSLVTHASHYIEIDAYIKLEDILQNP